MFKKARRFIFHSVTAALISVLVYERSVILLSIHSYDSKIVSPLKFKTQASYTFLASSYMLWPQSFDRPYQSSCHYEANNTNQDVSRCVVFYSILCPKTYLSPLSFKLALLFCRHSETNASGASYVYWTVHHLDSWIKIDQLHVTCFTISLFTAQHVSNVSTAIFRSLRLIVDLFHVLYCSGSMCVGVTVWFGWVVWYPYAGWSSASACIRIPHNPKLLKMDVLTFETCWAVNSKIIKQVTSSWSIFIQLLDLYNRIEFSTHYIHLNYKFVK